MSEALRLAHELILAMRDTDAEHWDALEEAAAELRRLHAALAEPEQEPVAWLFQHEETGLTECVDTQQVDWGFEKNNPRWQKIAPLYTAPPQRQWQGLTADEIWACNVAPAGHSVTYHISMANQNVLDFAEAIEAKLKEKNT